MDRVLLRGLAWTSLGSWGGQLIAWTITVIVLRLLTPADYGLVGMAGVYIGLLRLVNELGLGAAIVQRRSLSREEIAALGGISLSFGFVCCVASIVLAKPMSLFYREPRLVGITVALSVNFITAGLRVVPASLLSRDLRFRLLAALNLVEVLVGAVTSLILALTGFGYWALVASSITGPVAGTALMLLARPHPISVPRFLPAVRSAVRFGLQLLTARVASYAYGNADFVIIGRWLGAAPLGWYTVGWEMAGRPVEKVSSVASQVAYPVLAAVGEDKTALRRYVLGISEGLAILAFPIGVGVALIADDVVWLLLGNRWMPAVVPLRILALALSIRMLNAVMHQVLAASGNSKQLMQITLWGLVALPPLFYLGTFWGITGVAVVWLVANPLILSVPSAAAALKAADTAVVDYLLILWRPAVGTALMAIPTVCVQVALGSQAGTWYRLLLSIVVAVVSYGLWTWGVFGRRALTLLRSSTVAQPGANVA